MHTAEVARAKTFNTWCSEEEIERLDKIDGGPRSTPVQALREICEYRGGVETCPRERRR